ncbi:hypothetical protein [Chlorobium sp.]|jgi:hypothetical protein|uniref:hypothetical protein n=1 Tax=Chlorobium sp. TaxID=1095 RepID=UPI003C6EA5D2
MTAMTVATTGIILGKMGAAILTTGMAAAIRTTGEIVTITCISRVTNNSLKTISASRIP